MKGLIAAGFYACIDSGWKAAVLIFVSLLLLPILSSRFSKFIADHMMNPLGITNAILAHKSMQPDTRSSHHRLRHYVEQKD